MLDALRSSVGDIPHAAGTNCRETAQKIKTSDMSTRLRPKQYTEPKAPQRSPYSASKAAVIKGSPGKEQTKEVAMDAGLNDPSHMTSVLATQTTSPAHKPSWSPYLDTTPASKVTSEKAVPYVTSPGPEATGYTTPYKEPEPVCCASTTSPPTQQSWTDPVPGGSRKGELMCNGALLKTHTKKKHLRRLDTLSLQWFVFYPFLTVIWYHFGIVIFDA